MHCSIQGTVTKSFRVIEGLSEDKLFCNETLEDDDGPLSPLLPVEYESVSASELFQDHLVSPVPSLSLQSAPPCPSPHASAQPVSPQAPPGGRLSEHQDHQTDEDDSQDTLSDDKLTDSEDPYISVMTANPRIHTSLLVPWGRLHVPGLL